MIKIVGESINPWNENWTFTGGKIKKQPVSIHNEQTELYLHITFLRCLI